MYTTTWYSSNNDHVLHPLEALLFFKHIKAKNSGGPPLLKKEYSGPVQLGRVDKTETIICLPFPALTR